MERWIGGSVVVGVAGAELLRTLAYGAGWMGGWVVVTGAGGLDGWAVVPASPLPCSTTHHHHRHHHHHTRRAELVFTAASDCQLSGAEPNGRACKYALNTLMACCSIPAITLRLAQATLHGLVGILLVVLIDGGIQAMPQGGFALVVQLLLAGGGAGAGAGACADTAC
jgi:hypothetical protein